MILEQLQAWWTSLLAFTAQFVVPDWTSLINLLPVFLLLFVAGPILTLLALAWLRYGALKPRAKVGYADPRRLAPRDADGNPVFPTGEPYSLIEGMIYEPGATTSASGDDLLVTCPKCSLVRSASIRTCGNCGLSFTITPPTRAIKPAEAPPGGRAAV